MNHPAYFSYLNIVRTTARALMGRRGADAWLTKPNNRLNGVSPLVLASEPRGAERVVAELNRLGAGKARRRAA